MAISVTNENLRTAICNLIVDSLDNGAGVGRFIIHDVGNNVLCTVLLNEPAYGAASASVAQLGVSPAPSGTASAGAPTDMTHFHAQDSNGVEYFTGTIGTSGANINFSSVAVTAGVTVVEITSAPFTVTA
jgi:hypothetical protein